MRAGIDSFPYSINFADLPYIEQHNDINLLGEKELIEHEFA